MEKQSQQPSIPQVPIDKQARLPYSTGAWAFGVIPIVAIALFFLGFFQVIGYSVLIVLPIIFFFGIIAIVLGCIEIRRYKSNPKKYSVDSYRHAKIGIYCGIFIMVLSVWFFVIIFPAMMGAIY